MPPAPTAPLLPPATPGARRSRLPWIVLGMAVAFALFGAGVVELFQLRFETGDIYPAYSTLRNDPLGAAAFYEALENQPGVRVTRSLRPLAKLDQGPAVILGQAAGGGSTRGEEPPTCFYLGADPYEWPTEMDKAGVERLEEILRTGGRVVMTFLPGATPLTTERLEHSREDEASPQASPGKKKRSAREERMIEAMRSPDLIRRWGVDFRRVENRKETIAATLLKRVAKPFAPPNPTPAPTPAKESLAVGKTAVPVPGGMLSDAGAAPWHTALDFDVETREAKAAGWHALYRRDGQPVIVARPYGVRGGELVLASDSYFLSNEALRAEPCPGLLAGLVGKGRRLLFDESHFGVQENPGLMTLARRYGLQGALAATGLLVGLFIWRNVLSLVPPPPASAEALLAGSTVTGRDSAAGFLNLVKRGVPPRDLMGVCLAQWQGGAGGRAPEAAVVERLRAVAEEETMRPARQRSPAAAYRAMCAAVRNRR